MDTAIINTILLTFNNNRLGIIKDGAIGIQGDTILFSGKTEELKYSDVDEIVDGTNHVTMPGLVNTHFHSTSTLLRGGAQDMPEIEWMNKGIGPLASHLDRESRLLGSKLAVLEGIRFGTTTFGEYTGGVADLLEHVYKPLGVRVACAETINEISPNRAHLKPTDLYEFDKDKGEDGLRRADQLFSHEDDPLISVMYGPQALDMISISLLNSIEQMAAERNCKIHIHVAQGGRERLQITGRYGSNTSTVKVLEENNLLSDKIIAAHCHDTSLEEIYTMVDNKVNLASCQTSIAMIDGLVSPLYAWNKLGGVSGLGTDQAPGPGSHNLFREMRTASLLAKVVNKDPTALPAWDILKIATVGGAKTLGLENKVGTLSVGKKADLLMVNLKNVNLTPHVFTPFPTVIPNLVYSATGFEVENVMINGKFKLRHSEFVNVDYTNIYNESLQKAREVFEKAESKWFDADSELSRKVNEGIFN